MDENNNNTGYLLLRQDMLRFAKKLDKGNNVFLKDFSKYLQETYEEKYKEKSDSDWRMVKLNRFLFDIYILLTMSYSENRYIGCALFGKTPFDKLDFIRTFLDNYEDSEYTNDGVTHNLYEIVDCEGKAKRAETIEQYARKFKDIPFVIFNNCENILNQKENLKKFKYFSEHREFSFYDSVTDKNKVSSLESFYILLGNENKMHEALERARPDSREDVSYRINTFDCFISIYDFDKEPPNVQNEQAGH